MKVKLKKIILEDENGKTIVFDKEYENINVEMETGLTQVHKCGIPVELIPNGHYRLILKAWSGMKKFEDFIKLDRI